MGVPGCAAEFSGEAELRAASPSSQTSGPVLRSVATPWKMPPKACPKTQNSTVPSSPAQMTLVRQVGSQMAAAMASSARARAPATSGPQLYAS
ncbi:MAG: hypothetical protein WBU92_10560 [Candidatus Dormiibacterota bacterium]